MSSGSTHLTIQNSPIRSIWVGPWKEKHAWTLVVQMSKGVRLAARPSFELHLNCSLFALVLLIVTNKK
jgi:hypothetical protein